MGCKMLAVSKSQSDDFQVWSISAIARNTGYSRDIVRHAMNLYEQSRGAMGLPFMRATESERRLSRKSMVLQWFERMEASAAHR